MAYRTGSHAIFHHRYHIVWAPELSFPLLGGPESVLGFGLKEERNGEEAQAGGDHRQAA